MSFDSASPDSRHGTLAGFILADDAVRRSARSGGERQQAICEQTAPYFGEKALKPREYIEKDWCADAWASGCCVGLMAPGTMSRCGRLGAQFRRFSLLMLNRTMSAISLQIGAKWPSPGGRK